MSMNRIAVRTLTLTFALASGSVRADAVTEGWYSIYSGTSVVVRVDAERTPDGDIAFEASRLDGKPTSFWLRRRARASVEPEAWYEVSCWLKGPDDVICSVGVEGFDAVSKDHYYFRSASRQKGEWKRFRAVFRTPSLAAHPILGKGTLDPTVDVLPPAKADSLKFGGWKIEKTTPRPFAPRGTRESLVPPDSGRRLPPPSPLFRAAGPGNRLFDGSFELPLPQHVSESGPDDPAPVWEIDETTCVHGRRSLRVDTRQGGPAFWSGSAGFFPAETQVVFSVHLKADRPCEVVLSQGSVSHDWATERTSWSGSPEKPGSLRVSVGTEWKRHFVVGFVGKTNPYAAPRLDFPSNVVCWVDAAQVEAGPKPTDFAPAAPLEARITMRETVLTRREDESRSERAVLDIVGYTNGVERETRPISFKVDRYGTFDLTAEVNGVPALPETYAVVREIGKDKAPSSGVVFGCNGSYPALRGRARNRRFGPDADGMAAWYRFLRLAGCRVLRMLDDGPCTWRGFEREKGRFTFELADRILRHAAENNIDAMHVMGGNAFLVYKDPWPNHSFTNWFVWKSARPSSHEPPDYAQRLQLPRDEDWYSYAYETARHFRGRMRYHEVINEPNIQVPVPEDYLNLLKLAHAAIRKGDPEAKVVGICSTGDFGADAASFVNQLGELGAFDYFDILSFHPYCASTDVTPVTADTLLGQMKDFVRKYRPDCQLAEDEDFYLCDQTVLRNDSARRERWPVGNLVRRLAADAHAGCVIASPMPDDAFVKSAPERAFLNKAPGYVEHRIVPSELFAVANAAAYFLEGAVPDGRPKLPKGLNGYRFRDRFGRRLVVLWAKEPEDAREYVAPEKFNCYDLLGNPLPPGRIQVTADAVYVRERDS